MKGFWVGLSALRALRLPSRRPATPTVQRLAQQSRYASYQRFGGRRGSQYIPPGPIGRVKYIWINHKTTILTVGVAGGGFYVYNLEEVPITGRRRFNVLSAETEKKWLYDQGYNMVLQEFRGKILPENHQYTQLVKRVVERLLPAVGEIGNIAGDNWVVHVIDKPDEKNAFVMPGGKVFVFTGILPICQDEDGVAAVLGHEIAHNVAHHSAERLSNSFIVMIAAYLTAMIFDVSGQTSNAVANLLLSLPNSRTQEAEADHIGLLLMAQSCFDPNAVVSFWQRMTQAEKAEGRAPPEFMSTHPNSANRVERIRGWLPEADVKYQSSDCGLMRTYAGDFKQAWSSGGPAVATGKKQVPLEPQTPTKDNDDFW